MYNFGMSKVLVLFFSVFFIGCSQHISKDIPKDGIMQYDEVTWPKKDDGWIKDGTFPNLDNLSMVRKNMTKDQIYHLIGHPQYSEGLFSPIEWDYLFNFVSSNNEIYQCQYKIIFDKDRLAQSFFFNPKDCLNRADAKKIQILFDFDKSNVRLKEKERIIEVLSNMNKNSTAVVYGYTDPIGTQDYNLKLSQKRADNVEKELKNIGFKEVQTQGFGEKDQVKQCYNLRGKALTDCLEPNRRVTVDFK